MAVASGRALLGASALSAALLTSACPPGVTIRLHNRTSEHLAFVVWEHVYSVPPGSAVEFPLADSMQMRSGAAVLEFQPPSRLRYAGPEYVATRWFRTRLVMMEIRDPFTIYLMPAFASGPREAPYEQDYPGFPLLPKPGTVGGGRVQR